MDQSSLLTPPPAPLMFMEELGLLMLQEVRRKHHPGVVVSTGGSEKCRV